MELLEGLEIGLGFASILISLIAIIAIVLVKKHIVNILDKDVQLLDGNFSLKFKTITNAMNLLDAVETGSKNAYAEDIEKCINELMLVCSNSKTIQAFVNVLNKDEINKREIIELKKLLREEIGFKRDSKLYPVVKFNKPSQAKQANRVQEEIEEDEQPVVKKSGRPRKK